MSRKYFEDEAISRFDYILNDFINLAINRFSWSNLPYGLTSEQLEYLLIRKGTLAAIEDKHYGILILPCFGLSDINVYGQPMNYQVMGENGKYNETFNYDDIVLLKNNPLGVADMPTLEIYAKRIDDLEMTQDVNLFQQATPKIILCDEDSKLTAKNLIDKIRKFKLCIFAKRTILNNITTSDVLDTSSPYVIDKLQIQKDNIKSELLTFLGINNNNIQKKERLISDEVNSNNEFTSINLDLMFDLRKKFCDEVNKKFNLNITVEKREVDEVGEIYSNTGGTDRK